MAPTSQASLTDGAKKLGKFLKKHGITRAAAAAAIGATDPTVCDWIGGKKRPREAMRAAIEVWTDGEVLVESWLTPAERKARVKIVPFSAAAPTSTEGAA